MFSKTFWPYTKPDHIKKKIFAEFIRLAAIYLFSFVLIFTACSSDNNQIENFHGDHPIIINPDSGWCWFQDERAVIDNGTILLGGVSSNGDITLTVYDFERSVSEIVVLHENFEADDHNVPTILVRPDGRYLASYTRHNTDHYMRYRVSTNPGNPFEWEAEQIVDVGDRACYSNVYYLANEDRTYNFHRGKGYDPNFLISDDFGDTWEYGGKLWEFTGRPYPRYASDGYNKIHIITTEAHPRVYPNSIYHGYIKENIVYRSGGIPVGGLSSTNRSEIKPTDLTMVFQGDSNNVAWTSSIEIDNYGNPYIGYSVTKDQSGPETGGYDHRYRYARWDGSRWHDNEIAYAGSRLYRGEDEYTGLITVAPGNPNVVYISTNADPATGKPLISEANGNRHYEIFRGTTNDFGATWVWYPVTNNSASDNIRPIVLSSGEYFAVIWLHGVYNSYTDYNLKVVGFVLKQHEI